MIKATLNKILNVNVTTFNVLLEGVNNLVYVSASTSLNRSF